MDGKTIARRIFHNYFYIFIGMMLVVSLYCKLFRPTAAFTADHLLGFMLQALIMDVPQLIYYTKYELTKTQWLFRRALHLMLLEILLLGIGTFHAFFTGVGEAAALMVGVALVFGFVSLCNYIQDAHTAEMLNKRIRARRNQGSMDETMDKQ